MWDINNTGRGSWSPGRAPAQVIPLAPHPLFLERFLTPDDDDAPTGAVALAKSSKPTPKQRRALRRNLDAANDLIREAAKMQIQKNRVCNGKVKLRDAEGNYLRDADGKIQTRPCRRSPLKGTTICHKHGGSSRIVKARAEKRLRAMLEPAIVRLEALAHQDDHLPTALGATLQIMDRTLGKQAQQLVEKDARPVINIGIKVGGINPPGVTPVTIDTEPISGDE